MLEPEMMDEAQSAGTEMAPEENPQETQRASLNRALSFANLAEGLKKKEDDPLKTIGHDAVQGYNADEISRQDWMERNKQYMKLATQVVEKKTFPWEDAANVKYPLLTTAALQFASRAYPSLVPSLDVVKAKVVGNDEDGKLTELANKLSTHLSYQVIFEMEDWEESMDRLCFVLPIVGCMFKKVYYSNKHKRICSELLSPKNLVVNYYTEKLKDSSRVTEIQYFTPNEILEYQRKGIWVEYDEPFKAGRLVDDENKTIMGTTNDGPKPPQPMSNNDETPRKILIQYTRLDLDEDGYKEPYIVTVDYESERVLSIVANFYVENIEYADDKKNKIACIQPAEWFVKFDFLPNPDGGFYGIGFGILLGGINEMVNTLTNQLIDAGTLSNLQAGFLGKGLRDPVKKDQKFRPGEWKYVNNPGKDLKENIFPLPVREPSSTLFQLLGTLVQSGKELASVADIFTGKMPGQNTPAATTMATIEQGLKVFTSIYKRIYRGMGKEFQLIFKLSTMYAPADPVKMVMEINGESREYGVSKFDYQRAEGAGKPLVRIIPAADPNMVSETQKLLRIQGLYELANLGTINKGEMTRQALVYQGQENIQKLMELPPPQPPIEIQVKQMELQDKEKDRQIAMMKEMSESQKRQSEIVLNLAKAKQLGDEQGALMLEAQLKREEAQMDIQMKIMELMFKQEEHRMDMQMKKEEHGLDMMVNQVKAATDIKVNKALGDQKIEQGEKMGEHKMKMAEQQAKQKEKLNAKQTDKGSMG